MDLHHARSSVDQRRRKTLIIFAFFACCIAVIIGRLVTLQILYQEDLELLGSKNFTRVEHHAAPRGNFYDCNNVLLATNKPLFDVYWQGCGNRILSAAQQENLQRISTLLAKDFSNIQGALGRAERFARRYCLAKNLDYKAICQLSEQCFEGNNLSIESRFERSYPHGTTACHILGYLGRNEKAYGQFGLERMFESILSGQAGVTQIIKNATGRRLQTTEQKKTVPGKDIHLTIDATLQKTVQDIFREGQKGACVILDPLDGSIKTLASYPGFDPNLFLAPLSHEDWAQMSVDNPFLNRALKGAYPPASLFKLITFAAGLETGLITPTTCFECGGSIKLGNRTFYCMRRWGHGMINSKESLAFSCNIPCYQIASYLGIDELADYAARFGLGNKTDVVLPELSGCVPTKAWKQARFGERWWRGETLCSAIGQSYLLVTPLQTARMIAGIFTGFLAKPRLLLSAPVERNPLAISLGTRLFLQDAMHTVVQRGTARMLKKLNGFELFAKTGTAQTVSLAHASQVRRTHKEHAWFASYFSYKSERPLVIVIFLENTGTSRPVLKMAKEFLQKYAQLHNFTVKTLKTV